jgi:hypothetical protein
MFVEYRERGSWVDVQRISCISIDLCPCPLKSEEKKASYLIFSGSKSFD